MAKAKKRKTKGKKAKRAVAARKTKTKKGKRPVKKVGQEDQANEGQGKETRCQEIGAGASRRLTTS